MENQKTQGVKLRGRGEKPSLRLARFIIKKQKWIESVFAAGCLFSLIAMLFVNVNYDLTEYLPDTARAVVTGFVEYDSCHCFYLLFIYFIRFFPIFIRQPRLFPFRKKFRRQGR